MKKALTILLLVFCLSGIYVAADERETARESRPEVTSILSGTVYSMSTQRRRHWRRWRRWHRRWRRHRRM